MKALDLIIRIATLIALAAIALALTRLEDRVRSHLDWDAVHVN
jgi:hypothetical protein